jgi:hypothetical protein
MAAREPTEFGEDPAKVGANGPPADVQNSGDHLVGMSFGHYANNLLFAIRPTFGERHKRATPTTGVPKWALVNHSRPPLEIRGSRTAAKEGPPIDYGLVIRFQREYVVTSTPVA